MSDKQSNHTTISILNETYETINEIRQRIEDETGMTVSNPNLMRKIVKFYIQENKSAQ